MRSSNKSRFQQKKQSNNNFFNADK